MLINYMFTLDSFTYKTLTNDLVSRTGSIERSIPQWGTMEIPCSDSCEIDQMSKKLTEPLLVKIFSLLVFNPVHKRVT